MIKDKTQLFNINGLQTIQTIKAFEFACCDVSFQAECTINIKQPDISGLIEPFDIDKFFDEDVEYFHKLYKVSNTIVHIDDFSKIKESITDETKVIKVLFNSINELDGYIEKTDVVKFTGLKILRIETQDGKIFTFQ